MSKGAAPLSALAASRLSDGRAVFLNFDGVWVEDTEGAVVARSPDEARALETRGSHDAQRNLVAEPHLIDVCEVNGRLVPLRHRERVRFSGVGWVKRSADPTPATGNSSALGHR